MKSYLDISKCSKRIKERLGGVEKIPVRIGRHHCDIDVKKEDIPDEQYKIIQKACENNGVANKEWPVGFFVKKLPDGAVLHIET